jgi:hypothetical protein
MREQSDKAMTAVRARKSVAGWATARPKACGGTSGVVFVGTVWLF